MKGYTAMTTQFNKDTFVAQFSSFSPANDWEYKFAQSLHKQVVLWKKDLSEKQVECWNKMIAPKVALSEDQLSKEAKDFIAKAHQVIAKCKAEDKWDIEFSKSLIDQVSQGKELSAKQKTIFDKVYKKKTEVKVDPSKAVEAPKAKTTKAKVAEAPKVETPKVAKVAKAKVAKVVEIEEIPFEKETPKTKTTKAKVAK